MSHLTQDLIQKSKLGGGPAHPQTIFDPSDNFTFHYIGMTLRDEFATRAPPAPQWWMETNRQRDRSLNPHNEPHRPELRSEAQLQAAWAYEWGQAMLDEKRRVDKEELEAIKKRR